jgi:hypothetical protein
MDMVFFMLAVVASAMAGWQMRGEAEAMAACSARTQSEDQRQAVAARGAIPKASGRDAAGVNVVDLRQQISAAPVEV